MDTHTSALSSPVERDDFDDFLEEEFADPTFAAAFEDAAQRTRLVNDLRACRKAHRVTQRDLAAHMGVGQSTISEFESATDTHLSTVQRYARGLGARLMIKIELPADQSWSSLARTNYQPKAVRAGEGHTAVEQSAHRWVSAWGVQTGSEVASAAAVA